MAYLFHADPLDAFTQVSRQTLIEEAFQDRDEALEALDDIRRLAELGHRFDSRELWMQVKDRATGTLKRCQEGRS
jgi:hypothetical protein